VPDFLKAERVVAKKINLNLINLTLLKQDLHFSFNFSVPSQGDRVVMTSFCQTREHMKQEQKACTVD
jgi:hypothetical protein